MLWALVSDSRPDINGLAGTLAAGVEKLMENDPSDKGKAVKDNKKLNRASLFKKQTKKQLGYISSLEQEIASGGKLREALLRENKHLLDKNNAQQALMIELRRNCGEFAKEKGILNKEAEKNKNEILRFSRQVAELKNEMAVGPKMRLKAALQRLQKENNGLNYMLEKERRQTEEKMRLLEKELLQAKQDIEGLARSNAELSAQIEAEQQRYASLQREYLLASIKKEVPLPKEKGRRVGIFIDNQNVYYSAKAHFGKKLDFQKFLPTAVKGRHLVKAICYIVTQPDVNQDNFISMLKNNSYTVRTRELIRRADGSAKGNWDIGIAADVITMVEKNSLDVVVLVTCDGDFVDLVKLLSAKGIRVEVVGFPMNTAMALKAEADEYYFITEDLMRSGDNTALSLG